MNITDYASVLSQEEKEINNIKNTSLISAAKVVIDEFKTSDDQVAIFKHICRLQGFFYKAALRNRLYLSLKRKGELDYSQAQEKNKFLKNGQPMSFTDLHKEFAEASKATSMQAEVSVFDGVDSESPGLLSVEYLFLCLKTSVRFLMEFVLENKVEDAELTEFLASGFSKAKSAEDLDFRDGSAIIRHLISAIEAYHQYQIFMAGHDRVTALEKLKNTVKFTFESYEFIYKHYIYTSTKYLIEKGELDIAELSRVEKFKQDHRAMSIDDVKKQFRRLYNKMVDEYGAPELAVNLNEIHKGWQLLIGAKHFHKAPKEVQALPEYIKGVISFAIYAVSNGKSNPEFDSFLAENTDIELDSLVEETDNTAWDTFYRLCNRFESGYHYILVAPEGLEREDLGDLFGVNWDLIIDFNPASENEGLMDAYRTRTGKPPIARTPTRAVEPFRTIAPPYWIRANGVYDDASSVCGNFRQWRNRYGQFMSEILLRFHSGYTGFLKIIYLPGLDIDMQAELMTSVEEAFADESGLRVHDVEQILLDHHELAEEFASDSIICADISMDALLDGISAESTVQQQFVNYRLPGMDPDASIARELDLEDFCEPVYEGLGTDTTDLGADVRDFYRGARPISWRELALRKDLPRDAYQNEFLPELKRIMREAEHFLCCIRYKPGLGGTTLLRRIAWDMHMEYPTLIVHRYDNNCEKKIQALRGQITDGRRLLLLVDSNDMSYANAETLFRALQALSLRFFMIYLNRREIDTAKRPEELFVLKELNSHTEIPQMVDKLLGVELKPACQTKLERLLDKAISLEDRTPFYLSMYAFDEDFVGFRNYVAHFLEEPTQQKYRDFLVYIALHDLVTNGPPLDAEFFVYHMDGVRTRKEARDELCKYGAFKSLLLFHEENKILTCKFRYSGIARALLCQLTNNDPNADIIDYLRLASYVVDFIKGTCIRGRNDNLVDFLKRLLIDRDDIYTSKRTPEQDEYYYEERERFSPLILKIGTEDKGTRRWTDSGRAAVSLVFRTLADCYPDNPHFIAHYARFLSEKEENHAMALEILDRAISMGGDNTDNTLLHMKGTVYSRLASEQIDQIKRLYSQGADITESIHVLRSQVQAAQEVFTAFQAIGVRGVTGLLSDCKLCIRVIEMGMAIEHVDAENFFMQHKDDWYMTLADRALSLYEACEKYRDEIEGEDLRSYHVVTQSIYRIRNSTNSCIAHFEESLSSASVGRQLLRRHLVRAYIDGINNAQDNSIDKQAYWRRIRQLTEDNIREDPTNSANYRHWFRAAINCRDEDPDQLMLEALRKVNDWLSVDEFSPEVQLYRYILNFLLAVDGSTQAEQNMEFYRREMQKCCTSFVSKTNTLYWLGPGRGLQRLIPSNFDMRNPDEIRRRLQLQTGRLHYYETERKANIKSYGAEIFFMPQQTNGMIRKEHFESQLQVLFYIGFSYDGPRTHNATVELKTSSHADEKNLNFGDRVRCSVLEQKENYLILGIRNSEEKAKLYLDDLKEPYSRDNVPAVMVDLDVVLWTHSEIFEGNATKTTAWLVKMDDGSEESSSFNKPLADNEALQEALKRFSN